MYTRYEKGLLEAIREMGGVKIERGRIEKVLADKMSWDIGLTRKVLDNLIDLNLVTCRDGKLVPIW